MTYLAKPRLHHPTLPVNKLGFTRRDYEGKISTLSARTCCAIASMMKRAVIGVPS